MFKACILPKDTGQNIEVRSQADAQGAKKYCICIQVLKQEDFLEMSFRKACECHKVCNDNSTLDWDF